MSNPHGLNDYANMHCLFYIYISNRKMDDEAIFEQFLNHIGLTLARQRTAVTDGLVQTFQQLSLLEDEDIDGFVKQVNEQNRNRPNN